MAYSNKAFFDTLRSTTPASIGAAYATFGSVLTYATLIVCFKNYTNGDVYVSTDGTNDHLLIPANSYTVYDLRTNAPFNLEYAFAIGTQFYVKDGPTAPTTGTFVLETLVVRAT